MQKQVDNLEKISKEEKQCRECDNSNKRFENLEQEISKMKNQIKFLTQMTPSEGFKKL